MKVLKKHESVYNHISDRNRFLDRWQKIQHLIEIAWIRIYQNEKLLQEFIQENCKNGNAHENKEEECKKLYIKKLLGGFENIIKDEVCIKPVILRCL